MLQAAEKRKQKKLQVLQKLYENLDKRIVPDKEVNYDLLQESRYVSNTSTEFTPVFFMYNFFVRMMFFISKTVPNCRNLTPKATTFEFS